MGAGVGVLTPLLAPQGFRSLKKKDRDLLNNALGAPAPAAAPKTAGRKRKAADAGASGRSRKRGRKVKEEEEEEEAADEEEEEAAEAGGSAAEMKKQAKDLWSMREKLKGCDKGTLVVLLDENRCSSDGTHGT